jgi:hypothetical protein
MALNNPAARSCAEEKDHDVGVKNAAAIKYIGVVVGKIAYTLR